jgi:hypothetical protein
LSFFPIANRGAVDLGGSVQYVADLLIIGHFETNRFESGSEILDTVWLFNEAMVVQEDDTMRMFLNEVSIGGVIRVVNLQQVRVRKSL